jgi:hypothetical protein
MYHSRQIVGRVPFKYICEPEVAAGIGQLKASHEFALNSNAQLGHQLGEFASMTSVVNNTKTQLQNSHRLEWTPQPRELLIWRRK